MDSPAGELAIVLYTHMPYVEGFGTWALQSSDWGFLAHRAWAGDYPRQRASGHAAQLARALKGETDTPYVRNLAPYLEQSYS